MANNYEVILSNDSEAKVTLPAYGYEKLVRESERLAVLKELGRELDSYYFNRIRDILLPMKEEKTDE